MQKSEFGPGSRLGIVGSGQLGRMLALAARRMGYAVSVYSPERQTPAGAVADKEFCGEYEDPDQLAKFSREVDVVTFEFENISRVSLDLLARLVPVRPSAEVLYTYQHRAREKNFLQKLKLPLPRFAEVKSEAELKSALSAVGLPAVLKTAGFGYDGKGQVKITSQEQLPGLQHLWNGDAFVLEEFVKFKREVSMVAARSLAGTFVHYGLIENAHSNHILDYSLAPLEASDTQRRAEEITRAVFEAHDAVGVMCVEFFELANGELLINEVAPRTHNSGHLTLDACETSQFEQQLRAVCGLSLGSTAFSSPAAMVNLLGDIWAGGPPDWKAALRPGVKLHLYGKSEPRAGRKMGHLTALAPSSREALALALDARSALTGKR